MSKGEVRFETTFLMLLMLLMCSCIVTLPSAPLLDLRRRLQRLSWDVLDAMIQFWYLFCSFWLNSLLSGTRSLLLDPCYPFTFDDDSMVLFGGWVLVNFIMLVTGLHRRLSDFIHSVVVHRRDDAIRGWRNWIREDPMAHPEEWRPPDLDSPSSLSSV